MCPRGQELTSDSKAGTIVLPWPTWLQRSTQPHGKKGYFEVGTDTLVCVGS